MDVRQLRYFKIVAELRSYTRAAEVLCVTRQALSKTVKQLEAETGKKLVRVADNQIELTPEGENFLVELTPVLDSFEAFEGKYRPVRRTSLTIAMAQGALHPLAPDFLERFARVHENIALQVEETNSDDVLRLVQAAEADVGMLGTHPDFIQKFNYRDLAHPGYFISVPFGHALSGRTRLTLGDLDGQHFVTLGKRNHLHRLFMDECEKAGVMPDILVASTEQSIFESYRQRGMALSFACAPQSVQPYGDVDYVPLEMRDADVFGTYIICRKDAALPQPAQEFWEYAVSEEERG